MAHEEPTLAVTYLGPLLELCERRNVGAAALLAGTGLSLQDVNDTQRRVPWSFVYKIYQHAVQLTGEPALSFLLGQRLRVTTHGFLGYALMTSATVSDAAELMAKYVAARSDGLRLNCRVEHETAWVSIESTCGLRLSRFFLESTLVSMSYSLMDLCGFPAATEIWVEHEEPDYYAALADRLPCRIRYGMPANQCRCPASVMGMHPILANPAALELAVAQCERELARQVSSPLVKRVRDILHEHIEDMPDAAEVARRCHLSTRSLKRKLAEQGASYSELLVEVRREVALALLRGKESLTVDEVARRVGYTEASSFCRAFKSWTGKSPGQIQGGT